MGLFNPKLQETSGSSVTQQSAVQKPNIAGGIANVIGETASIFSGINKAKEEGATSGFLDKFTQDLTRISMREQQDENFSSNNANSEVERLYTQALMNPRGRGLVKELGKIRNSINEVTGSFEEFETPEQTLDKKLFDQASTAMFIKAGDSPEQIAAGKMKYAEYKLLGADLDLILKEENVLKVKNDRISKSRLEDLRKQKVGKTKTYLNNSSESAVTGMEAIYSKVKFEGLDASEGERLVGKILSTYEANALSYGVEDTGYIQALIKPVRDQATTLVGLMSGDIDAKQAENKNKKSVQDQTAQIYLSSPEAIKFAALSKIAGNNIGAQNKLTDMAIGMIESLSVPDEDKTGDSEPLTNPIRNKSLPSVLEALKTSSTAANKPVPEEGTVELKEELKVANNNILKSIADNESSIKSPNDLSGLVSYFASPAYKQSVKDGAQNPETAIAAETVMQDYYAKPLMDAVKKNLDTTFSTFVGSIPFLEDRVSSIKDIVDVEFTPVGIVYRAKPDIAIEDKQKPAYNKMIKTLNDTVANKFNTYNAASANLRGRLDASKLAEETYNLIVDVKLRGSVKEEEVDRGVDGFKKGFSIERGLEQSGLGAIPALYFDGVLPKAAQSGFFSLAETLSTENVQKLFASVLPENTAQKAFREYEESKQTPIVTETVAPTTIESVTSTFEKANIDLSGYEDGIYDHPNGTVMTIKDGVIVGVE